MGEGASAAREAVSERASATKDAAAETVAAVKPRLRGVIHSHAFWIALLAGAALVVFAPNGHARTPAVIYAATLCGLLGTSALYHRVDWPSVRARLWMRRLGGAGTAGRRRRALHRRRRHLRDPPAGSPAGGLRLPRGLPRLRGRGGRRALRRRGGLGDRRALTKAR